LVSGTCRFCAGCRLASMRRHTVAARRRHPDVKQVASTPMMDVKVRGQACLVNARALPFFPRTVNWIPEFSGTTNPQTFSLGVLLSHLHPSVCLRETTERRVSPGGSSGNVLHRGTCAVHRPFPVYGCFTDWSSLAALKGKGMRLGPTTLCGPRHVVRHAA
jgi:hypothetical protein